MSDRKIPKKPPSRRQFLETAGRLCGFGALAALAGWTCLRGGTHDCTNQGQCVGCGVFGDCRLPPAEAQRRKA